MMRVYNLEEINLLLPARIITLEYPFYVKTLTADVLRNHKNILREVIADECLFVTN